MGKYCLLQGKRTLKILAWTAAVLVVVSLCLGLGLRAMAQSRSRQTRPFPIGLVGVPEDGMLRVGLSALESFDEIGLAMEIVELTAEEAPAALETGRVKAYAVIPENFGREASHGNLLTIQYVTTADTDGLVTLFQQEITGIIGDVLLQSEKASFGTYDALEPYVGHRAANRAVNDLSNTLAEFIFVRNRTTLTVELGVGDAPSFGVYMACGVSLVAALLLGLCFAPVVVQQNLGVSRMLLARGRSLWAQALADYGLFLLGLWALTGAAVLAVSALLPGISPALVIQILPALALVAALGYLCYSLVREIHSGLLLYFFTALALALVGGCMYPAWFFPVSVQRLAAWLPVSVARSYVTGCVTGAVSGKNMALCLGYGAGMVAFAAALRVRRVGMNSE